MFKRPTLLVLGLAALPLAACSSTASAPASAPTVTPTTTVTAIQSATATRTASATATATATSSATVTRTAAASSAAPATSAAAAPGSGAAEECLAKNLELTQAEAPEKGVAGSPRFQLRVKNIGATTCTLRDPKLTWVTGPEDVEPLGLAGDYKSHSDGVSIKPGATAAAYFWVGGNAAPGCTLKRAFALGLWTRDGKAAVAPMAHDVCVESKVPDLDVEPLSLA